MQQSEKRIEIAEIITDFFPSIYDTSFLLGLCIFSLMPDTILCSSELKLLMLVNKLAPSNKILRFEYISEMFSKIDLAIIQILLY